METKINKKLKQKTHEKQQQKKHENFKDHGNH